MSITTQPTAGGVLAATTALQGPQQTYTREQVAYLLRLAYDSGRTARYVGDLAELHAGWAAHPLHQMTAEQRYAERMAEMDRAAREAAARQGQPYRIHRGGPVDWETGA